MKAPSLKNKRWEMDPQSAQVPAFEPLAHLGKSELQKLQQPGNVIMTDYFGKNIFSPHSNFVLS